MKLTHNLPVEGTSDKKVKVGWFRSNLNFFQYFLEAAKKSKLDNPYVVGNKIFKREYYACAMFW